MRNLLFILLLVPTFAWAQKTELTIGENAHYEVKIYTSVGNIEVKLFNDTPIHRDNFVKLVNQEFYNHIIFHRVIKNFMIQAGDPDSKNASPITRYGDNDCGYKLPSEITTTHFHKKGTLAAAREPDEYNPEKMSSGSQFYIVTGKVFNDSTLNKVREIIETNGGHEITDERAEVYKKLGGAPHLDGSYTIFGEVIAGLKTIDKIGSTKINNLDRPIEDIFIKKIELKIVHHK